MNDNGQNFSNGPYKATRNLNTMIENPDINVNSATTVNIMESNGVVGTQYNSSNNNFSSFNNSSDITQSSTVTNGISNERNLDSSSLNSSDIVNTNDSSNALSVNNFNSVHYENVYQTGAKKQSKKTVSIPSEFKTAIFVVLILLVGVFCFEPIYDFFRNLNIFG